MKHTIASQPKSDKTNREFGANGTRAQRDSKEAEPYIYSDQKCLLLKIIVKQLKTWIMANGLRFSKSIYIFRVCWMTRPEMGNCAMAAGSSISTAMGIALLRKTKQKR